MEARVARNNFKQAKRQRDLAKQKKQAEKRDRKRAKADEAAAPTASQD